MEVDSRDDFIIAIRSAFLKKEIIVKSPKLIAAEKENI